MAAAQGLVWVAEIPQRETEIEEIGHPGDRDRGQEQGTGLLRVIERNAALKMVTRRDKSSHKEQGRPEHVMRQQEQCRVVVMLGHTEELFANLRGGVKPRPHHIKGPETKQHPRDLRGFPHLTAQGQGACICVLNLGSAIAFRLQQGGAQSESATPVRAASAPRRPGGSGRASSRW